MTVLRDLWRLRLFVAGAALIAVFAAVAVGFKISPPSTLESRRYEVGVATGRILVDTPASQVVEVSPKGSDMLGVRANLIASLMVDGQIKSMIAQRAGLKPAQLVAHTDAATSPTPDTPPSERTAFILKTQVLTNTSGDELPIIEIDAQAPSAAAAARLASAALAGLRAYLNSKAAVQQIPDADRLQVDSLGAPQVGMEDRGPSPLLALIAAVFVFFLGCGTILLVRGLRLGLRAAAERERLGLTYEEAEPPPVTVVASRPKLVPPPPANGRASGGQFAWDAAAPLRAAADD